MDFLLTAIEVGLLIFSFSLLNWLVSISFQAIVRRCAQGAIALRQNISLLLLLTCVGLCLLVVSVNGFLIYQGKSVQEFQLNLVRSIPTEFWLTLAGAIAKTVILLLLVKLSLPFLDRLLDWGSNFAKNYDRITANDHSIEAFFTYLKQVLKNSIWILAGILCTQFLQLPEIIPNYLYIALKAYVAVTVGQLLIKSQP